MRKLSSLLIATAAAWAMPILTAPSSLGQQPGTVTLSPSTMNFGYVVINGSSVAPTLVTLTNGTSSAITITGITVPTGFTRSAGQNPKCSGNLVVQPGGVCYFNLSFSPAGSVGSGTGSYLGTAKVLTTGGNPTAALSGFATDPEATASLKSTNNNPNCGPQPSLSPTRVCYTLTVSNATDNLGDVTVNVIVDKPPGTPIGTILYTGGGGGASYYQAFNDPNNDKGGQNTISQLLSAGYISAQTQFLCPLSSCSCSDTSCHGDSAAGWLTYTPGSGTTTFPDGPRILASRYVAVARWVKANVLTNNTAYCATGNSAGGAAIAYGLSHFGLDQLFNFVEVTSGPPLARLDYACGEGNVPNQTVCLHSGISENVGTCAQECILDPAFNASKYSTKACSQRGASSTTLVSDSVDTTGTDSLSTYGISIRMLLGQNDADSGDGAVAQGMEWYNFANVSSSNPAVGKTSACVPNAGHGLPGYQSGSMQIIADMENIPSSSNPYGCALPSGNARLQSPARRIEVTEGTRTAAACVSASTELRSSRH